MKTMIEYRNIRDDVLNNKQSLLREANYKDNNIIASSNVGLFRNNQEDSLYFATKDDVSMLAVADGMGGEEQGEVASNICVSMLLRWFDSNDLSNHDKRYILKDVHDKLGEIDEVIRNKCGKGGTTLSLALVFNKETFIFNVGDSRIYIYDSNLRQVTEDNSRAWRAYKAGIIPTKDDIRFYKENNFISSKLGGVKCNLNIYDYLIPSDYNYLLVMSDGVTDILRDDDIKRIILSNDDNIARNIVLNSLFRYDSCNLDNELFNNSTNPGKDNSTAIVLRR